MIMRGQDISDVPDLNPVLPDRPVEGRKGSGPVRVEQQTAPAALDEERIRIAVS